MSVLNPEVIFPEDGNFCGVRTGKRFYSLYTNAGNNKRIYSVRGLMEWDVHDLDPTVHTTYTNGLRKEIATLPNGVKLVLSAYVVTTGGQSFVDVTACFLYNGVLTAKGNANTGPAYTVAASQNFGIKCFFAIDYPQEPAVSDVTKASGIGLLTFIPNIAGSAVESWAHIQNDAEYKCEYVSGNMIDEDFTGSVYYPSHYFVSSDRFLYYYTDLQTFVNEVNALVPTDPITVDDIITPVNPDDPSQDVDPSQPGGGGGSYVPGPGGGQGGYIPGDPVDVPPLPVGGSAATGAIKSFLVTTTIIQALFKRLWNNNIFDVITWQKIIEEPLDAIVSLICVPVTPTIGGVGNIQLGNIDTQVGASVITNQYVQVNAGSVTVPEFWGSALDYSPYTKIQIFVPGVGIRPLKAEDVINQTLSLAYNFDVLTGNFTAHLKCGQSVLYKFPGNMKATIPITSRIYSALETVMKGAGSVVNSYATGAMTAGSRPDATPQSVDAAATHAAAGAAISAAINVAMSKTQIQRSGDISGSAALLDDFVPYLIIHRPVQSLAKDFKKFKGYPSNITALLSSLTGYTEVEYVHLENISGATDEELVMIERLLKSGVII